MERGTCAPSVMYAFSPLPDFTPVTAHLDYLVLIPTGIPLLRGHECSCHPLCTPL